MYEIDKFRLPLRLNCCASETDRQTDRHREAHAVDESRIHIHRHTKTCRPDIATHLATQYTTAYRRLYSASLGTLHLHDNFYTQIQFPLTAKHLPA